MSENLVINPDTIAADPPKKDLHKDFLYYRKTLEFMGADVPIQVLCLPKNVEKTLISQDILRVYDLIGLDFTKIEGVGTRGLSLLTSRFNEFFSMNI